MEVTGSGWRLQEPDIYISYPTRKVDIKKLKSAEERLEIFHDEEERCSGIELERGGLESIFTFTGINTFRSAISQRFKSIRYQILTYVQEQYKVINFVPLMISIEVT